MRRFGRRPCYGQAAFRTRYPPERAVGMDVKIYVGNLPRSMTGADLDHLFAQAGDVKAVDLMTDRVTGGCKGYAYITMSAQSEADRAVSMFDAYALEDHLLKVTLARPREQRGFRSAN